MALVVGGKALVLHGKGRIQGHSVLGGPAASVLELAVGTAAGRLLGITEAQVAVNSRLCSHRARCRSVGSQEYRVYFFRVPEGPRRFRAHPYPAPLGGLRHRPVL
ncbi:hypothetical protein SSKA14_1297 [Stenotrophomonas sp. SKA14]|nr:hypothetical protein SSKA14_1297 [Stenotrophomonas sp. SKA14]